MSAMATATFAKCSLGSNSAMSTQGRQIRLLCVSPSTDTPMAVADRLLSHQRTPVAGNIQGKPPATSAGSEWTNHRDLPATPPSSTGAHPFGASCNAPVKPVRQTKVVAVASGRLPYPSRTVSANIVT